MKKISFTLLAVIIVVIVGGTVWLGVTDPPAPVRDIEQVVPNDRFPG